MFSSHNDVVQHILGNVADTDMPIDVHYDKDGYIDMQFNYGGMWFDLTHTDKWVLVGYIDYDDCNTGDLDGSVVCVVLGKHIKGIVRYVSGKMIIIGDTNCYVFSPDGDDE